MAYLSTQPYKGTRDFFPADMRFREAMFGVMHRVVRSYGFDQIDAPLVEPVDLYLAKTSEEIVGQQIYSFKDRGDRQVAARVGRDEADELQVGGRRGREPDLNLPESDTAEKLEHPHLPFRGHRTGQRLIAVA